MAENGIQHDLLQTAEGENGNMELDSHKIIIIKYRNFKTHRKVEKLVTSRQTLVGMPKEIIQSRENNFSGNT